ncbi:MAG: IMS domain-containing protein [Microcoleaceae cyanobacterium]
MRIPLDYYRILGLPIQATAEQLHQAHRDRAAQLPRREYSDVAIASRKHLVDEAYTILSDPDQRQAYDKGFLAKTYLDTDNGEADTSDAGATATSAPEERTPSVEIDDKDFIGALLILQELGEYEQVVKLSLPYLSNGAMGLRDGRFGDPELILPDVILTAGLAHLELGREKWQQGQYEKAAESLQVGQDLLLQENLFPSLRGEMQADLYKLRPYRVLELLQYPTEKANERRKGLQLLREMLHERGGIDGHGDDRSGLNVEDFLRFIQQLRRDLTTTEQQALFETEARRPSAVATYLAVYALIAQGFANAQPALIRKAKLMLMQLGRRQDVHLEKSVCSLLLGQTEEASRSLELSQEKEPIAFIKEQSKDAPDLLPGLCLYSERWLQDEVFPHFKDLANRTVSLKDYFSNEHVQSYLEALSTETESANEWEVVQPRRPGTAATQATAAPQTDAFSTASNIAMGTATGAAAAAVATAVGSDSATHKDLVAPEANLGGLGEAHLQGRTSESAAQPGFTSSADPNSSFAGLHAARGRRVGADGVEVEEQISEERRMTHTRRNPKFDSFKLRRLLLLGMIAVLALWFLWWVLSSLFTSLFGGAQTSSDVRTLQGEQAMVRVDRPPIPIPQPKPAANTSGDMTPQVAEQIIGKWLAIIEDALGPEHQNDPNDTILTQPALTQWVDRARTLQRDGAHRLYEHSLSVNAVEPDAANPNRATADATVREAVQFYENDQLVESQDENLQIQYQFVREQGQPWQIEDWQVLN